MGKGFDEKGCDLSGGQWQRLAIARGLFSNSKLLVLEEPSAALDPRSEASLYKQIKEMAIHHTLIMISHRLGSTKLADRIVVLADSRIVEIGSLKNHILHRNPCHWLVSLT